MNKRAESVAVCAMSLFLWNIGCSVGSVGLEANMRSSGLTAAGDAGLETDAASDGEPSERSRAAVCQRWTADYRAAQNLPGWNAARDSCAPGALPAATRSGALRLVNTYRWLAGLDPVGDDPHDHEAAQACAVLMGANGRMDHHPERSWRCWSELGFEGASRGNIIGLSGTYRISAYIAVSGWMEEARDLSSTLGHRRWILAPDLGPIGYGQSVGYACMYVLDARMSPRRRDRVSWPSAGYFPMQAMPRIWSLSSVALRLSSRTLVTVSVNGRAVPVTTVLRPSGPGDDTVSWDMPTVAAGSEVSVRVSGVTQDQSYVVRPVDCR